VRRLILLPALMLLFAGGMSASIAAIPDKGKPPPLTRTVTTTVAKTTTVTKTRTRMVTQTSGSAGGGSTETVTVTSTATVTERVPASNRLGVARFRETQITHAVSGDLAASVETWRTRVWLAHKNQVVGTGALACIRLDDHTSIKECMGTYILPRGRIQVAGEIISRAAFQLTIVGGTGVYAGSKGTAIFAGLPRLAVITFYLT